MRELTIEELETVNGGDGFSGIDTAIVMIAHGLWVVTDVLNCGPDPDNCTAPAPSNSCGMHGILCA